MKAINGAIHDQRDRWFLWYVVCFAVGIAAYFALPREPFWPVLGVALCLLGGFLALWRRTGAGLRLMLLVFFLAGFVVAKAWVEALQTAVLPATTPTTQITGTVISSQRKGKNRTRIVLQLISAKGIKNEYLPKRVRLSGKYQPRPLFFSDKIELRARLFPLPGPVRPRGYDFGRALWFDGIGATGFYYGDVKRLTKAVSTPFHPRRILQQLRHLISQRIEAALKGASQGFARALIIGDRSGIDQDMINALRAAGLAHILAISGLHMSLVAGGSFWLLRALFALSPGLALNNPIKKWAAVGGLLTGAFYLAISGTNIATQRAFIMAAVMFMAILLDRPALSMRNVAIAALAILVFRPEAVLTASFQMSFMAVTGLVGWYEYYRHLRAAASTRATRSVLVRRLNKVMGFFTAIVVTTLVASIFTGVPAAYHFHKVATWSLLGNVVALPVVTVIVMPAAVLAVVLMPLGLEFVGLRIMAVGTDFVLKHAERIASLPNAQSMVPDLSVAAVLLIAGGLMWLCLWRGQLKFAAIAPIVLAATFLSGNTQPDFLVSKFGRNVAIRGADGLLVLADNKKAVLPRNIGLPQVVTAQLSASRPVVPVGRAKGEFVVRWWAKMLSCG